MLPILFFAALTGSGALTQQTPVLSVTAVPSRFTPDSIVLQRGVATRIVFSHIESVHSVESESLGIPRTTLSPGQDVSITVTPRKDGTFTLHCEVPCGEDHQSMALRVTVKG